MVCNGKILIINFSEKEEKLCKKVIQWLSDELDIANLKIKKLERENKLLKNQIDNLKFECVKSESKKATKKVEKEKDTTTKKKVGRPRKVAK